MASNAPVLFELRPFAVIGSTGKPVSARTQASRRSEARRIGTMHGRHGHGAEGQTCRGCVFLVRSHNHTQAYLKCERYRVSSSEATDWRAKWPACGAFAAALHTRDGI